MFPELASEEGRSLGGRGAPEVLDDLRKRALVHVVDDEPDVAASLAWLLDAHGWRSRTHPSGEAFLRAYDGSAPGCVLLDLQMPGCDGLQTQMRLREQSWSVPVIIVTGHGDLASAVKAMKAGAVDVLEKPYDQAALLETVTRATAADDRQRREEAAREDVTQRFAKLTPRQRTVAVLIADGLSNRAIAFRLGLSHKTVEVHRANLMRTVQASNTAHLVRLLSAVPEVSGAP